MAETIAYKIMTDDAYRQMRNDDRFVGGRADIADGFIHLSAAGQLSGTIDKHYRNQTSLVLVAVDLLRLGDAVRWELSRGGDLFPHLYGVLPLIAVVGVAPMQRHPDGTVKLPSTSW
jgi:uncharacterized protein (DUF952 family)